MGEVRIKENDGGSEFNCIVRTFVNVTMYPQYNNNAIKKRKNKRLKDHHITIGYHYCYNSHFRNRETMAQKD
jgi:hypothetical protein